MLQKTAISEGRDWDKLLPYVLFAYREVPQASTRFSPFELLYGRPVREPLDLLRESWESCTKSDESVVSYVLSIREKMDKMTCLVQRNLAELQRNQKVWYACTARASGFKPEDRVLVFLTTSTHKLRAQWQGRYTIVKWLGDITYMYVVDMANKAKCHRTFHVNMLRQWHEPEVTALCTSAGEKEQGREDVIFWYDVEEGKPTISQHLSPEQHRELRLLVEEYGDVSALNPLSQNTG